jgi:hypothetical protein
MANKDDLYHVNQMSKSHTHGYALGTEFNKVVTDVTEALAKTQNTFAGRNGVLNAAGLAVSATDLQYQCANVVYYMIDGTMYSVAADTAIAVNSGAQGTLAASAYAVYLCEVNATGTYSLQKGADGSTQAAALANLPTPADNKAPVGMIIVQNNSAAFKAGSTTAGQGDFADDTTADTYVDFVGGAFTFDAYTQTCAAIANS